MNVLNDILSGVTVLQQQGHRDVAVNGLQTDSRAIMPGDLFIALKGTISDGHAFIDTAIQQGAIAIVCEVWPEILQEGITYLQVSDCHFACGQLAAAFYHHPSRQIKVVGITGTNGKTTCATLLYQLFQSLGYSCGLLSTVCVYIGTQRFDATHTTPDAITLQHWLAQMAEAGCTHVFMEVSSHAIDQKRIQGIEFSGACFTNITHDHLDYHKTFDAYIRVKKSFFDALPSHAFALSNADDKRGMVMLQNTQAKRAMYSLKTLADFQGRLLENTIEGLEMSIQQEVVFFRLIGEFNAYNLLCVYAAAVLLGEEKHTALLHLSTLSGAEGRFETIRSSLKNVLGIIDYAHTPDALLNVLNTIHKIRKPESSVCTVIGCGGNRDKQKRPVMGLVACEHSDKVVFTSDNPRNEEADQIIQEMEAGVAPHQRHKYIIVTDRKQAIRSACSLASPGDIILLAGKGHERYQEIKGIRHPFDDKAVLQEMFETMNM